MQVVGDIYGDTLLLKRAELELIAIALEDYYQRREDDPFRGEYKRLAEGIRWVLGDLVEG